MAVRIKKRYARATRFRTIMSNNLQTKQTRRQDLVPSVSITGQVVTFTFDRPVTILSDAATITGIRDQADAAPTSMVYGAGGTNEVDITFPGAAPTTVTVPFEDNAIRDQIGAYVRPGDYSEPG